MTALVVEGLEVRYGPVRAVRGLSFEVRPGEIVGLIGPNGAGKSSTLHAIMGAAPIAAGTIRLGDTSLLGRRSEDIARSGIALVPEGRRIFGELSVEENLRLGLAARRSRRDLAATLELVYELFPVVRSVRDEHGAGVLLIDHNMSLIMAVCDRIQVLDQGRTLAEGTPAEIRRNLDVTSAYLGGTVGG